MSHALVPTSRVPRMTHSTLLCLDLYLGVTSEARLDLGRVSASQAVHQVRLPVDREFLDEGRAHSPCPSGVVEAREHGLVLLVDVHLADDDVRSSRSGGVHHVHPARGVGGSLQHCLQLGGVRVLHHAVLPELQVLGIDDEERDVAGHGRLLLLRRKGRG